MTSSCLALPDDKRASVEASRQVGRQVGIERIHISLVRAADTVFHEGKATTVCHKDLKSGGFMGRTLFGDSYVLGRKPVQRLVWRRPRTQK